MFASLYQRIFAHLHQSYSPFHTMPVGMAVRDQSSQVPLRRLLCLVRLINIAQYRHKILRRENIPDSRSSKADVASVRIVQIRAASALLLELCFVGEVAREDSEVVAKFLSVPKLA